MDGGGDEDGSWPDGWSDVDRPFWPDEPTSRGASNGRPYPGARFGRPIAGPGSLAGFGARFWGFVCDWFVVLALVTAVRVLGGAAKLGGTAIALVALVPAAVYTIVAIGGFGRTLGQRANGLEVLRTDGRPASWGNAVRRWLLFGLLGVIGVLAGFPEVVAGAMFAVLAWMFVDRARQGLHDKVAGVIVVRADDREPFDRESWERR